MSPSPLSQTDYLAREQRIIDATLSVLETIDVAQLTMDKVVKAVPFSKGTVYSHFNSKEDLLCGLSNFALRHMTNLFGRIPQDKGNSRSRLMLFSFAYLIYAIRMPTLFRTALCAKSPSVMGKTSPARAAEHDELEQKLMNLWFQTMDDGIKEGGLVLPDNMSKHQTCFSLWSCSYGTIMLLNDEIEECSGRKGMILEREYFNNLNLQLDGLNWQPTSQNFNYHKALNEELNDLFSDELEEIRSRGRPLLL